MARNKRNSQSGQATAERDGHKGQLEKLVPTWTASFKDASKIYQTFNTSLDIQVDEGFLRSLIDRLNDDEAKSFATWVRRFAEVCKEFSKHQSRLHEEYEERWEKTNNAGQDLEIREQQLIEQQTELDNLCGGLEQQANQLEQEEARLAKFSSELVERERAVKQRELNAETGFAEQNLQTLRVLEERQHMLDEQYKQRLEQLHAEKSEMADEIRQSARRLAEIRHSCSEAEAERTQKLEAHEHELSQRKVQLDRERTRLDRGWSDLNEAKRIYQEHLDREMALERSSHKEEVARFTRKLESAWSKSQELKNRLADLDELKSVLGEQSAGDILEQLDNLQNENRELRRGLDQSDTIELQRENEYLRNRAADLERDIADIRPKLDNAYRELGVKRVSATELEAVAREKRVLEHHKNTLSVHIDDLESRIDQLTDAQKTQTPFPAMSGMDKEKQYRSSIELENIPSLDQFAVELQHRIAQAEKVELFYPLDDIRVLLGGLAMSQLHVFQGISGTGKTSLAKAFAKAMGGFCTDIAVQAGWRDRDDLLGHYNAFERRFYEKDCLQALYKAQTSRWQDTCNVILLDEMNLSRPEQYFAEFLSALEKNDTGERLISLSETALPNAPAMLRDGRQIRVPANVWFIGTANHDETTNELADKTYDRAHVMTLPKQDHRFDIKPMEPASYSFGSLQKAFDRACNSHENAVRDLLDRLSKDNFTEHLGSHFGLGWGNRFDKQAQRFIPVMLATGATTDEALDHMLSTRVMRQGKVTGRYDVSVNDIRELKDALESFWKSTSLSGDPVKSVEMLEADIKRKEGGI